ncbi:hypothetical protein [Pseudomonas sp. NPDC096950]|uniref:hypothetical protein n=1 Tax=Pseudomonas sp. NPDC096950 TaxID=3364485 RepID=UPI00383AA46A
METENPLYTLEDMRADQEAIDREMKELHAKNQVVLDQVQALVSPEAFQQIQETLSDSEYTCDYQIVGQPVGVAQDEGYVLGDVFVNQTMNGGFTGDEYAGTICMPITADSYFQFHYTC